MPPAPSERAPAEAPPRFVVRAYPAAARAAAGALRAFAALSAVYLGAHVFYDIVAGTDTAPPEAAALGFLTLSALPWLLAALLGRAFRGAIEVGPTGLTLSLGETRYEIPLASIKALRPFALPLPGPGLALELGEGRLFRYRLQLDAPGPLLSALAPDFGPARDALALPPVVYADTKHEASRRRWYYHALKWVAVPLAIALVLFRLNQVIMYGGAFGQYQMYGLGPYLRSLALYWAGSTAVFALYAAMLRAVAETAVFAATWLAPARARALRRAAEAFCQIAYFVVAPGYVAFRLLQ
jgi:hypothetical protein